MPKPRDQLGHFHPRKLSTFTGLGPLGDLDLQLFAMVQILRCNAKPATGDLLDLRRRIVPVWLRREMRRVLAALAGIRLCADPVHRDVQGLMRLGLRAPSDIPA